MVDTISKINHWFRAYTATLAFIKMGRKLFDKDTQVDVYIGAAQTSAFTGFDQQVSTPASSKIKTSNLTGLNRYAVAKANFFLCLFIFGTKA